MQEILKINLDNEMDLILAHRRSMKIAELCGLPSASQTRFSTAVSEIARCSIANGKSSSLSLGIEILKATRKNIVAIVSDAVDLQKCNPEAYKYAGKISGNIEYEFINGSYETKLTHSIPSPGFISDIKVKGFKDYFKLEPPISPYDEIRKKNLELIALSEKLGESENKYRDLANSLPVLICTVDDRDKIIVSNTWLNKYLHASFDRFDKKAFELIFHSDDVNTVVSAWEASKKNHTRFQGQVRLKHDHTYVWHLLSIIPNKVDGTAVNWIVYLVDTDAQQLMDKTLKDNSELKQTQEELETLNLSLSAKNRELEQFAFVASHDLQEPLRKIMIMISKGAENMTEQEKQKLYFDRIHAAAHRMSNLITDVLNFSRMDNLEKNAEKIDLNKTLKLAVEDTETTIQEKDAKLDIGKLPNVIGIRSQMHQLFLNLINNALKFNNKEPMISIDSQIVFENIPEALPGRELGYHQIQVTDNGIGMDEQYSDKVFKMFHRLHHRDVYGGNGIGLALCRRIAENHGGTITFQSAVDKGTTFSIYLPVVI